MNRPNMLTKTSRHRRGNSQGLMNPREVMVNVKECDGRNMVLNLFAEGIGQASEAAHLHPHVEILSLDIAGADVLRIGVAKPDLLFDAQTLRGAVPLLGFRIVPEHLDELRVVDVIG